MEQLIGLTYSRKSIKVKGKTEKESILYQENELERYALNEEIKIIKHFNDIGYSGSNTNRPALQEMLTFLRTSPKKLNYLLIYSTDRLGRDLEDNLVIMDEILKYVDKVIFVKENLTSASESFWMLYPLFSGVAEDNRERLRQQFAGARYAKVIHMKYHHAGFPPIGTVSVNKKLVGATERNTDDLSSMKGAMILKHIYYQCLMGDPLDQIAKSLAEMYGLTRRGKVWGYSSVRKILKNPAYISVLRGTLQRKIDYCIEDANVEKLIDPLIFEMVQQKLAHEGKGRPFKSSLTGNALFTLCLDCGTMLQYKKDILTCSMCHRSVSVQEVSEVLIKESNKLLVQNDYQCLLERNKLIDVLRNNKKGYEDLYDEKTKRIKELEEYESTPKNEKLLMMKKLNTEKFSIYREKVVSEALIEFISETPLQDFEKYCNYDNRLLLQLPFVIVVDLNQQKSINVIFHREAFLNDI